MHLIKQKLFACLLVLAAVGSAGAQLLPPSAPRIVRVTVDTASGLAGIEWRASTSPDVEKYTMYYDTTDILGQTYFFPTLDTVNGSTRSYTFDQVNPSRSAKTLTVVAIDSIGNASPLPEGHRTMRLETLYDSCLKTMQLKWSSYGGWGGDLVRYEVYCKVDRGAYNFIMQSGPEDTTELHMDIEDNHLYCYFIKAISPTTHSFSNIACRNVVHPAYPEWINAESASAAGPSLVEVKFAIDPAGEVSSYRLYKAAGPGKPFIPDVILRDVGDSLTHQDPVISTELRYLYKLYALDVCDHINEETESNVCGNIVLNARSVGLQAYLGWNPYWEFEAGVNRYNVYRNIKDQGSVLIGSVYSTDTSYQDDLGFVSGQQIQDEICYRVVAEEDNSYTRGSKGFSWSNEACVSVVPEMLMANAIIPNSAIEDNARIKPVLTFIPEYYLFQVYDRWGSRIFETHDPERFWEGDINGGRKVPEGVYVYYIRITTSSGIEVEKKGEITVFYK